MHLRRSVWIILGLCLGMLGGCSGKDGNANTQREENTESGIVYDADDWYSEYDKSDVNVIDLDAQSDEVIISEAGSYELSGTLKGSVVVQVKEQDSVRLILNHATIQSEDGPAILATQGEKLILSLPEGSENVITDGTVYRDQSSDAPDAAVYVKNDLTINGDGRLSVTGNYRDAIKTKDTLKLMSGSYVVKAADDGIIGRDFVYVHDGAYAIEAAGDGIKTTYDSDDSKGDIIIEGGTFDIQTENDGIQSEHCLSIYDGTFTIQSGGGSVNGVTAKNAFEPGGFGRWNQTVSDAAQTEDTPSAKGIKSGSDMILQGGIYDMDTSDDSFHSNAGLTVAGGSFSVASGDDGFHSDGTLRIQDGSVDVVNSYEGLEGSDVIIDGGYLSVKASDDGINAAGGSDADNASQPSPDHFADGDHRLEIHGGVIQVDAMGDGLDANGSIVMDGGSVVICGPEDGANGALDYETEFEMNGGILIALGSSQMAQAPSQTSSQYGMMVNVTMQEAKSVAYLCDEDDNVMIGFTSPRAYSSIVISTPQLQAQGTYRLYVNASGGTINDNGYMESDLQGGTLADTITLTSQITISGNAGMDGMNGGRGMDTHGEVGDRDHPGAQDTQFPQKPPQTGEIPNGEDRSRQ